MKLKKLAKGIELNYQIERMKRNIVKHKSIIETLKQHDTGLIVGPPDSFSPMEFTTEFALKKIMPYLLLEMEYELEKLKKEFEKL